MGARRGKRFTYANVMPTFALFVAVGTGSAYATSTRVGSPDIQDDSIQSVDIKGHAKTSTAAAEDGTITTYDIKNGTLLGGDLKNASITGAKVAPDSLTGANIDESTLGPVPNAYSAYFVQPGGVDNAALQYGSVTPDKLAPVDAWHYIRDPGEPPFENGWHNYDTSSGHQGAWHN